MDEWDTLMDIYYNGMPEGADTGLENLDRLIKFERGFVLTVTGVPGSGKSEFVDEIAMRLLLRHDWKVGYFSPENTPLAYHYRKLIRRVVGKRFEHKGMPLPEAGQAIRYLAQSVFSIMPKEDFSVESVLRIAAQLVSRKGVKVLVVDPFNRFRASDSRLGNGNAVHQPHLRRVLQFCREAQGVAHSGGAPHQVAPRTGKQTLACAHAV